MTTTQRCLIATLILLVYSAPPVVSADLMLGTGVRGRQPADATSEAGADAKTSSQPCLAVILSWAPVLLLVVIWILFMRRYAKTVQRSRQHMDELERLTREIVSALGRIEQTLDRK